MKKKIEKLLIDYQKFHSEFQIDNFIIGSQGCIWSQYKQALREIESRYNSFISQEEEIELFDLKWFWRWPFGRKAEIIADRRKRKRRAMVNGLAESKRELTRFVELAINLKKEIGHIDTQKRAMLETDSWRQKALHLAGVDLLVNGRVGQSTMEFILQLPKNDKLAVLNLLAPESETDPMLLIGL